MYNEAEALREFLGSLVELLEHSVPGQYEIIVVDDASTDASAAIAASAGPRVKVLPQSCRRGSGAARKVGSHSAVGDIVVWVDGDGTYLGEDVLRLAQALGKNDQMVGARQADFGHWRWLRLGVKRATALLAGVLWRTSIPDLNSGLRAFRRQRLQVWLGELPDGFSCTTTATLAGLNHRQSVRFAAVAYRARLGESRSKFHPLWDTFRLWRAVGRCWCRRGS